MSLRNARHASKKPEIANQRIFAGPRFSGAHDVLDYFRHDPEKLLVYVEQAFAEKRCIPDVHLHQLAEQTEIELLLKTGESYTPVGTFVPFDRFKNVREIIRAAWRQLPLSQ
jgi:hypothetical protein